MTTEHNLKLEELKNRCFVAQRCLPASEYANQLAKLHGEMLALLDAGIESMTAVLAMLKGSRHGIEANEGAEYLAKYDRVIEELEKALEAKPVDPIEYMEAEAAARLHKSIDAWYTKNAVQGNGRDAQKGAA